MIVAVALLPLAVWAYLLFGRGWFWLCRERDDSVAALHGPPPEGRSSERPLERGDAVNDRVYNNGPIGARSA